MLGISFCKILKVVNSEQNCSITIFYFLFTVQVSTILQLLNVPGTPSEWKKTFETIQDSFGAEGRLADLVWYFVGAPGSQEQWRGVVQNMQYKLSKTGFMSIS